MTGYRNKPRNYSLAECHELIKYLKKDSCSVMIGVPNGWRDMDRDAMADPELHGILQLTDVIHSWTVGRYRDVKGVTRHTNTYWQPDIAWCDDHKIDCVPAIFPGFS